MTTNATNDFKTRLRRAGRLLGVAAMIAAPVLTAEVAQAQVVPITIVSVGDSYASGEGAPDQPVPQHWQGDNRDNMADRCHRSNLAAPAVAAKLVGDQRPVNFLHIACSGDKIADLTGPGGQLETAASFAGGPIDALIISIGGNDIGFASIVGACLAAPCELFAFDGFPGAAIDLAPGVAAIDSAIRALPVQVRHVFVTEYPDPSTTFFPVPDHRCGTPFAMNILGGGFETLLPSSAEWAADLVVTPLNGALSSAVSRANSAGPGGPTWHYVGGISAAFHGHGYCMGLPNLMPHMWIANRMINTVADSLGQQGDVRGSMHPNVEGQRAAAGVIAGAIIANVPVDVFPPISPPQPVPPTQTQPPTLSPAEKVCRSKPWLCGD